MVALQVAIDDCLSVREGRLFIEACDAVELARRFGTPVTVISEDQLRRNARRYRHEFESRWPEGSVVVLASIKANFALATRCILTEEGIGCDAFGAGELYAALQAGVPPDRLSVNGAIKGAQLLETAIRAGARITLDNAAELDTVAAVAARLGKRATIRFRLRPDFSSLTEPTDWYEEPVPIAEAARLYKAGIPTEDVVSLGRRAVAMPQVDLVGLHMHIGRHTNRAEQWPRIIEAYVSLLAELQSQWTGWAPQELNLGGGYPVPRDPFGKGIARLSRRGAAPDLSEYASVVTDHLRRSLDAHGIARSGLRLEIEPGRGMYGDAGVHLATVRNIKSVTSPQPHSWIEVDTSDMFLPDVVWEHNRWTPLVANRADAAPSVTADIAGLSCQPDRVVPDARLPEVTVGDIIAILDTGAYQDGLAANFNALPRPGMLLVTGDQAEWIKRPETVADIFARDVVPDRLRQAPPTNSPS